jgi:hypothetical protein
LNHDGGSETTETHGIIIWVLKCIEMYRLFLFFTLSHSTVQIGGELDYQESEIWTSRKGDEVRQATVNGTIGNWFTQCSKPEGGFRIVKRGPEVGIEN